MPERLPDDAFLPVAAARRSTVSASDREAEPGFLPAVGSAQNDEQLVATSSGLPEDSIERGFFGQAVFLPEARLAALARCSCYCRGALFTAQASGCQPDASLGATALQYQTAGLGRHACAEAMRAGALQFAGLKGSLHRDDT